MPIYEYKCTECGHGLEKLQKLSDAPLVDCPECGKPGLKKMISAVGFRLKGAGWYETDFKSGNKKNVADSKTKTSTEPSTKTSTEPSTKTSTEPSSRPKDGCSSGSCSSS